MADRWIATDEWIRPVSSIEQIQLTPKEGGISIIFRGGKQNDIYNSYELTSLLEHHKISVGPTAVGVASSLCLEMLTHLLAGGKKVIRVRDLFERLVSLASKDISKLIHDIEGGKLDSPLSGPLHYILLKHYPVELSKKRN